MTYSRGAGVGQPYAGMEVRILRRADIPVRSNARVIPTLAEFKRAVRFQIAADRNCDRNVRTPGLERSPNSEQRANAPRFGLRSSAFFRIGRLGVGGSRNPLNIPRVSRGRWRGSPGAHSATSKAQPVKSAKLFFQHALVTDDDCGGISLTTRFRAAPRNLFETPPEQELATGRRPGINTLPRCAGIHFGTPPNRRT